MRWLYSLKNLDDNADTGIGVHENLLCVRNLTQIAVYRQVVGAAELGWVLKTYDASTSCTGMKAVMAPPKRFLSA
jgi:hypothetical protein